MTEPRPSPEPGNGKRRAILWIGPLDLLPGDSSVSTRFDAISSGVGGGPAGLVVGSSTTGDTADTGGNDVVWMGIEIVPDWHVAAVRLW